MTEQVLAGYALGDPLTAGGDVRTGRSVLDGSAVVVELLRASDPAVAARATAVRTAWLRADGRHLVRVREVVVEGDLVAVVRDAVQGLDLEAERVRAGGTLAPAAAAAAVAAVLDGLADLHAVGLVHGDVTPAAVRLDVSVPLRTVVRLTGWGTASLVGRAAAPSDDARGAGRLLVHLLTGSPEGQLAPAAARVLDPVLGSLLSGTASAAWARDSLRAAALTGLPTQQPVAPVPFVPPSDGGAPLLPVAPGSAAAVRRPRVPLPAVVALCLLVVLAMVAVTALVLVPRYRDRADGPSRVAASGPQPYVFAPLVRADGLVVERSWVLEQDGAVLRATTVVRNATSGVRSAGVDEVVPKSVADDVDDLVFTPGPEAIVQRDPIVRFNLRDVQPGDTRSWEFVVTLPAPLVDADLPRLADDAEQARLAYEQERRNLLAGLQASASPDPGQD